MALEFKKLSEVTAVEEISDAANLLVEDNGEIKRAPKTVIGGGIKGFIIFTQTASGYSCNHTFGEVAEMFDNLTLNMVILVVARDGRYDFIMPGNFIAYNSGGSALDFGQVVNNAEYFRFNDTNELYQVNFYRDGTVSGPVEE